MTDIPGIDTSTPHPARRYDYWLGGKDNFAADRASADLVEKAFPTVRTVARQNRAFLQRAVTMLAEQGIRQFLDIGAGLPSADNTHEVAQRVRPDARVVYVDNDPMVLTHGRALLTSGDERGLTAIVHADLRNPHAILTDKLLHDTLDMTEPVGLLLAAVLHFLAPGDEPHTIVGTLLDALPAGSWLVLSHASADLLAPDIAANTTRVIDRSQVPMTLRSHDDINRFFTGLEYTPPGLIPVHRWRPDTDPAALPPDTDIGVYGGVARKPAT